MVTIGTLHDDNSIVTVYVTIVIMGTIYSNNSTENNSYNDNHYNSAIIVITLTVAILRLPGIRKNPDVLVPAR